MSVAECFRRVAAQVEAAARQRASAAAAAGAGSSSEAAAAAGAGGVRLVCVSKLHPPSALAEAAGAGARHFGENYVAEAVAKAATLPPAARLHFIGTLQSNKARALVAGCGARLWAVESLDSPRLAGLLQRAASEARPPPPAAPPLRVFVQVNTSGEEQKGGVAAGAGAAAALARFVIDTCPALRLQGLMTIGAPGEAARACFERLAAERASVLGALDAAGVDRARYGPAHLPGDESDEGGAAGAPALELSMGMSGDFELAIACGSTSVRVGSSIFGERAAKASKAAAAGEGSGAGAGEGTGSSKE